MHPRRLTPHQRRFVAEYLVDFNAVRAAIRAGYKPKSARHCAYRLPRHPAISAAVEEELVARKQRVCLTADRVIAEYERIAFADIRDVADAGEGGAAALPKPDSSEAIDAAPTVAETAPRKRNGKTAGKTGMQGKLQALNALARHFGLFAPRQRARDADHMIDGKDARDVLRERLLRLAREDGGA